MHPFFDTIQERAFLPELKQQGLLPEDTMKKNSGIITLTTDFGTSDVYVGVMKGVILGINPDVQVVDITHAIPPQDVREAAFLIPSAHQYFPNGTIHVIVVDPGVGSNRQAIGCQTEKAFFVCPDNGILTYLLQPIETGYRQPHIREIVAIENPKYLLPNVSNTFHGRDIFAPVAAHLSRGIPLTSIGKPFRNLRQLTLPEMHVSGDTLTGQIIKIDCFGNLITNISQNELARFTKAASTYTIRVGTLDIERVNTSYAESAIGEPLAVIGSFGLLEIAINSGNAQERFKLERGDAVTIQKFD